MSVDAHLCHCFYGMEGKNGWCAPRSHVHQPSMGLRMIVEGRCGLGDIRSVGRKSEWFVGLPFLGHVFVFLVATPQGCNVGVTYYAFITLSKNLKETVSSMASPYPCIYILLEIIINGGCYVLHT